jgi:bacteriocin biosynthesis cyclodehydratase domain-containing protein
MTGSPTRLPRPTLLPGLRRLWRDRHTLQLGLEPSRAAVLEVADPGVARLLDLLDGEHTERAVLAYATRSGIAEADARGLLDALRGAGLVLPAQALLPPAMPEPTKRRLAGEAAAIALRAHVTAGTPAQVLRRRAAARVVLNGGGRLAAPLATTLADAGVGHVNPDLTGLVTPGEPVGGVLTGADVRQPRSGAVAAAVRRAAPEARTRAIRSGEASFVVHLGADRPAALLAAGHARRRRPHLMIAVRDATVVVGPLVPPGGRPCLNCVDLHRGDRDPAWPALAAQLREPAVEPTGAATVLAAAAFAAGEVLAYLDGGAPETAGATVEISAPGRLRRRTWPPHPDCSCHRRRSHVTGGRVARPGTMIG